MKRLTTTTQHSSITSSPKPKKKNVREIPSRFLSSAQKPSTKRGTPSKPVPEKPGSLNRSFESSESSTLPSTRNLGKPSSRPLRSPNTEMKPLKQELKDLEVLQGQLMQWVYANAVAESAGRLLTSKVEEDIFDRGQQIVELKKQANALESDLLVRRQTKLLDDVLSLEYSSLKPAEEEILQVAASLQELEKASYFSLHRLPLSPDVIVDPSDLLSSLNAAAHNLSTIYEHVSPETAEVMQVTEDMKRLTETVAEEREEIAKAYILLSEVRKLYEEEKGLTAAQAQEVRGKEIDELLNEDLE